MEELDESTAHTSTETPEHATQADEIATHHTANAQSLQATTQDSSPVRGTGVSEQLSPEEAISSPEQENLPVRYSERLRARGRTGLYTTLFSKLEESDPKLVEFLESYMPDQHTHKLEVSDLYTTHAVIATSILQGRASRQPTQVPSMNQKDLPKAPTKWRDLDKHQYGAHFKEDAELELRKLESKSCWRVIPEEEIPPGTKPIPLKWVFTYKVDLHGTLIRCKSRIVARGDLQNEESIFSTYAATLAAQVFRIMMAIAAKNNLEVKQYDVVNAFPNAKRDLRSSPVVCLLAGWVQTGWKSGLR